MLHPTRYTYNWGAEMRIFMIIDFHTHSFPDDIADRAVGRLAQSGGIPNYLDGRVDSIKASMKKAGIDYSVLLPIATKPSQHTTITK